MKAIHMPYGVVSAMVQRFLEALGDDALDVAMSINDDPSYLKRLAEFAIDNVGVGPNSTSCKKAREIMGLNFFGWEASVSHFKVTAPKMLRKLYNTVPLSEDELRAVSDTHILVLIFPMSIDQIRSKVHYHFFGTWPDSWYNDATILKGDDTVPTWWLIKKKCNIDLHDMDWARQCAGVAEGYEALSARVVVYSTLLYFLSTGWHLFHPAKIRCQSFTDTDECPYVSWGDNDNVLIEFGKNSVMAHKLLVAEGRKL